MVKDGKYRTPGEQPQPAMFMPLEQNYDVDQFFGTTLVLRTAGPPRGMLAAVEREIRGLDASLAVFQVRTMDEHLNDALFLARMGATLFGAFGLLGLALAASYVPARRAAQLDPLGALRHE